MTENRFPCGGGCGRDAAKTVCIGTERILDSCRDRDCYENVRVFLTDMGQDIIEHTTQVRVKSACIAWTYIGLDDVQFNKGFYTVHIRFYVKLIFEACVCAGRSQEFDGIAVLEKRLVLYGGDSDVSVFRSGRESGNFCAQPEPCYKMRKEPTAVVEAVEPVVLDCRVLEHHHHDPICCCCCACDIPSAIGGCLSSPIRPDQEDNGRYLVVSLGIFSLVRMTRPAQYLVNASEFIVPDKECTSSTPDNPCDLFRSMAFPVDEFSSSGMPMPETDRHPCGNCD